MAAAALPASSHTRRNLPPCKLDQKPKRFSGSPSLQILLKFWAGPNWMVQQWLCLSRNVPEMCHLWSMKPKQIFDMGHFRETTQQFLRFKSSLSDVGVQKLQQWASANSIFLPSRQFWCLLRLPPPRISHSELHVLTPLLLVPLSGRSLELHFGGDFVRHEPVSSLQFRAPFGYLNLITNSIFGPACQERFFQSYLATELQGQNYKVCGWDRHFQTYSIFFFIYLREVPNFRPNPPTPDIWNSLITFRVVWDLGNGNPFPGWGDFGKSLVGYKNWSLKSILMGIQ